MLYHGRYFPPLIAGVAIQDAGLQLTTSDEVAVRKRIEDRGVGYE